MPTIFTRGYNRSSCRAHTLKLLAFALVANTRRKIVYANNTPPSPATNSPQADGYEYGAVDAPISIAWGVGVLAILTSFLPLALQGGEEALDEMRENEKYSFGKSKDILKGRGKRR